MNESGIALLPLPQRVLELQPHECDDRVPRRAVRRRACIEELQRDAVALVDQRGITREPATLALHGQSLGQVAKIPGPDAPAFECGLGRSEGKLRRLAELRPQRCQVATGGELLARRVDDAHIDPQVRWRLLGVPCSGRQGIAEPFRHEWAQCVGQRRVRCGTLLEKRGDDFRQGREPIAPGFRQRLQIPGHFFADHPGNEPRQPRLVELVQERQRHRERESVEGLSWRKAILERQLRTRHLDELRELLLGDRGRGVAHQRLAGQEEQHGFRGLRVAAPALERCRRADRVGNSLRIERVNGFFVDQDVLPPGLVLELGNFGDKAPVVREESRLGLEIAGHQRLADEDFARGRGSDRAIRHAPSRHEREPEQRNALVGDDLAALLVPARIEMRLFDQIAGDRFDPLGLDLRRTACVQARRLGQLGSEHPLGSLFRQTGSGVQEKPDAARAEILLLAHGCVFGLAADVRQQTGQERAMNGGVTRVVDALRQRFRKTPAELAHLVRELPIQIAPLHQAQVRDEMRAAALDQPAMRKPLA